MPDVEFDIATKIIPPDQRIWAIFPGLGRKFFGIFAKESLIFLDTPALSLNQRTFESEDVLRQHVAMSEAWQDYYLSKSDKIPSRRAESYEVKRDASFNALVGSVRYVFKEMKPGDLVLIGAYSLYDPILVGEIIEPYNPEVFIEYERYLPDRIPARRVKWLRADFERRFLPQALSLLLSNRRAVVSIPRADFGDEIYKMAYGDYVVGENSRYIYEGPKYNNIAVSVIPGIDLITYFVAAFNAYEEGELDKFAKLDIKAASDGYFEQDILYSFEIDFKSPGDYVLHARRVALPLLVAVLISATSGNISFNDARAAEIKNSATDGTSGAAGQPADKCALEIQEKYHAILQSLGADRFKELCTLNKAAQDGVGLKVNVKQKTKLKKP